MRQKAALEAPLFVPPNRHLHQHQQAEAAEAHNDSGGRRSPAVSYTENLPAAVGARPAHGDAKKAGGEQKPNSVKRGRQARTHARAGAGLTISPPTRTDDEPEEAEEPEETKQTRAKKAAATEKDSSEEGSPAGSPKSSRCALGVRAP